MKTTLIIIFCILSIFISWYLVRKVHKKINATPILLDVLFVFIPGVNLIWSGIVILGSSEWDTTNFVRKFFKL